MIFQRWGVQLRGLCERLQPRQEFFTSFFKYFFSLKEFDLLPWNYKILLVCHESSQEREVHLLRESHGEKQLRLYLGKFACET